MADCNNILDLRGTKLPIIINDVDTLHIVMTFTDAESNPRDMSTSDIELWINDIKVAEKGTGITVSGVGNNVVTVIYNTTQGTGKHAYVLKSIESGVTKGEIYGPLTINET